MLPYFHTPCWRCCQPTELHFKIAKVNPVLGTSASTAPNVSSISKEAKDE